MAMVADSYPKLKSFIRNVALSENCIGLVVRMVIGFLHHHGRMSCSQAAGMVSTDVRNKAQLSRFLARPRWKACKMSWQLAEHLLKKQTFLGGRFLLIIDATYCTAQGKKSENTFCNGSHGSCKRGSKKGKKKGQRYGRPKNTPKRSHGFTFALLITPNGTRIPWQCPHYTPEYCEKYLLEHRTTAQLAADLIAQLPLPEGADVVVLADTAYDAAVVQQACAARGYTWIVPCNPQRRLAGPKGQRPMVRSLLDDWSKYELAKVRFTPNQGRYVPYRRLSSSRSGPKTKCRTYYVHQEKREIQSVGLVQLVFSTTEQTLSKATPDNVKILMTNDLRMRPSELVELYTLRWQIELFFKELKSHLGADQYRFKKFAAVEGWMEMAVVAILYLEHHRDDQLRRKDLAEKERLWWQRQRSYGICQAIRLRSQHADLEFIADRLKTDGGTRKLKRIVEQSIPREYRCRP